MITPNFGLFLWILLVMLTVDAVCHIILGLVEHEKPQKFGAVDVLDGLVWLILILIVLLT